MSVVWRQLSLLLWKCALVKRRQKLWLAIELVVPCILFIIIALVRTKNFDDSRSQCHYDSKGMLSSGILPFAHSFFCSLSNKCNVGPTTGDEKLYLSINNPNLSRNESLVVDLIHALSSQLLFIGENPQEFIEFAQSSAEIIHYLANINDATILGRISDFFDNETNDEFVKTLVESGVNSTTANHFLTISLKPAIFTILPSLNNYSLFENPIFCDSNFFDQLFHIDSNNSFTKENLIELCDTLTIFDYMSIGDLAVKARLPKTNNSSRNIPILNYIKSSRKILNPMSGFLNKYGNSTTNELFKAIFCGSDPREDFKDEMTHSKVVGADSPFTKLRKIVINFVSKISPRSGERLNNTCSPINYHPDFDCSDLEGLLYTQKPALQGFILVTPNNPVTRQIIEKLNKPLQYLEYLRNILFRYPSEADNFQNALHNSDLWQASQNILKIINATKTKLDTNILFLLKHLFAKPSDPNSMGELIKNATTLFNQYSKCFLLDRFRFVENETILEDNAVCLMSRKQFFSGIVFKMDQNSTEVDDFITYKIRHHPSFIDTTYAVEDSPSHPFSRNRPLQDLKYLTYGFSFLQESIDKALIELKNNKNIENIGVFAQQEPFPCNTKDTFNVALFMPLFLLISFIFPSALLVKNIVHEKELRIKEQMRSMGLGDAVHFISWALITLLINFISILIIALITKFAKIFNYTDFTLLFFILLLFLFSSIAMSIFFSTLFNNANIGTACTCILWFIFFIPFQLKSNAIKTPTFNRICLLLPPTAMGYTFQLLEQFNAMESATWSEVPDMINVNYGLSLTLCMIMLVVDTFLFIILAWYISAVAPGEFGVRQPFYFPLLFRFWFPNRYKNRVEMVEDELDDTTPVNENFDKEPTGLKLAIHITSMSKVYENGTKALNNLNLRMYENQITGLLGHNGAGKTTTMSILSGLYSPTSGTAKIYSRDIRTDLKRARELFGICPQHNVLFTHLTVAEQLKLFAALKGVADSDLDQQVQEILESVSLTEKADELAHTLSGGMKRRLCIGIAFIGGSKFVILDEPTAGVDVTARKEIWKLLQQNKQGKTILLSTHHMDEADVLSDRIAILSHGECITVGSSVFLKRKFGNNMTISVVKKASGIDYSNSINSLIEIGKNVQLKLQEENDVEIVFRIPVQVDSVELEEFFVRIDEKLNEYKLGQYGLSAPTLQSIFVSLAPQKEYNVPKVSRWKLVKKFFAKYLKRQSNIEEDSSDLINADRTNGRSLHYRVENNIVENNETEFEEEIKFDYIERPELIDSNQLLWQHFLALIECRFNYRMRNMRVFLFQVILPIFLLVLCEVYVKIQNKTPTVTLSLPQNQLPLTTDVFGGSSDFYINLWDNQPNSTAVNLLKAILNSPGAGPVCSNNFNQEMMNQTFQKWLEDGKKQNDKRLINRIKTREYFRKRNERCKSAIGTFNYDFNITDINYNELIPCECQDYGWNCTLENWDWSRTDLISLNTTDRIFDLSGKNLSQFRMVTRFQQIINSSSPDFMGGFSLGHVNLRARNKEQIILSKNGWTTLVKESQTVSNIIKLNLSDINPHLPDVQNPFIKNVTLTKVVDAILSNLDTRQNVKIWYNNKMWPSLPIISNIFSNGLYRKNELNEIASENLGILTFNHPMNKSLSQAFSLESTFFAQRLSMFRVTCLLLVLSMIPAGFTVYLVEDRTCESFHLQLVGGLRKSTYWATSYFYDLIIYILVAVIIMLIYVLFTVGDFAENPKTFFSYLFIFIIYGMSTIPYAYVLQKRFNIAAVSFIVISVGCYFVGIVTALTVILIENLMQEDATLKPAHTICSIVFLVVPQYNLGLAIFRGNMVYQVKKIGEEYLADINRKDMDSKIPLPGLLSFDVMGIHAICLVIHIFISIGCLIFSQMDEFSIMRRKEREMTLKMMLADQNDEEEDEDVLREIEKVKNAKAEDNYPLIVENLAKAYSSDALAVRGISFAVEPGECFGLLGLNGAGKTTTFSMLTAKIWPGNGEIQMREARITPTSIPNMKCFKNLGFCPQFDALNMKLTTRENLTFFARIRGIKPDQIDKIIENLLVALMLQPYANTQTSSLSGGNRRKLSVAVALISQPSLVFLDEPSAGMDPGSQQFLWKVIDKLCKTGTAVVLTSHSMEECEALCTRIAIMDRGRIRCLGGKQHLKNKFGKGTMLTMKLAKSEECQKVSEIIQETIDGSTIEAIHCSVIFVRIVQGTSSLAKILKTVNNLKKTFEIEDFTLSQSTLDNVFQSIAERQLKLTSSQNNEEMSP